MPQMSMSLRQRMKKMIPIKVKMAPRQDAMVTTMKPGKDSSLEFLRFIPKIPAIAEIIAKQNVALVRMISNICDGKQNRDVEGSGCLCRASVGRLL